jgi:predicted Zn-dependent protease
LEEAERLARKTVELAAATDALSRRAESLLALAEVLKLAGAGDEADVYVEQALRLYARKGNVAAAARARQKYGEPLAGLSVPNAES